MEKGRNMYGSHFCFVLKNIKHTHTHTHTHTRLREQDQFLEKTKMMFSVFSKTVFKNNFQKHRKRGE